MSSELLASVRYRPTRSAEDLLEIAELYVESFPASERRPLWAMLQLVRRPECHFSRIMLGETTVGMLHLWALDGFYFGEHFAIMPQWRGQGIGAQAVQFALDTYRRVVIEVEPPRDEVSARRIAFYERMGFSIIARDYVQPQYIASLPPVPLYLMARWPGGEACLDVDEMVQQIRRVVYSALSVG